MLNITNAINYGIFRKIRHSKYKIKSEKTFVLLILALALFITLKIPGISSFGLIIFLLAIPIILSNVKSFLAILIAFKTILDSLYGLRFFGGMNVLQVVGAFVPIFLIIYMFIKKIDLKTYPFYQLLIFFVAEVVFGALITIYGNRSFGEADRLLRLLNGITCFFAIPLVFKSDKDINLFLKCWLLSASFPILLGLFQTTFGGLKFQEDRISGLYHDASSMYIPGLIFILVLFIYQDKFKIESKTNKLTFNFVFYLLLGIASFIIYRTYSKAGVIALAVILILFALMHKNRILFFMSCIIIFMIFFTENSGVYKRIERDLAIREQLGDYGKTLMFTGRVGLWEKNWESFRYYQPIHKLFGYEGGMGTHNDYLRILLDYGIIGFLLYIAIMISIFLKLLASLKLKQNPFIRKIIITALFSHITFLIISFGLTPSLQIDIQWFHWGIVGITLTRIRNLEREPGKLIGLKKRNNITSHL